MSRLIAIALSIVAAMTLVASPARCDLGGDPPRDFAAVWQEARGWARAPDAVAPEGVFTLRFDPKTRRAQPGRAVTRDEPYRSPFYPWPEPSRPGVRFTVDDVERYGREIGLGRRVSSRPGAPPVDEPLEACGLVVGFTENGQGAEAIECYQPQANVLGQRANTEFVVHTAGDRRFVSRLYERLAHISDHAVRKTLAPPRPGSAQEAVQIDGKIVERERDR